MTLVFIKVVYCLSEIDELFGDRLKSKTSCETDNADKLTCRQPIRIFWGQTFQREFRQPQI